MSFKKNISLSLLLLLGNSYLSAMYKEFFMEVNKRLTLGDYVKHKSDTNNTHADLSADLQFIADLNADLRADLQFITDLQFISHDQQEDAMNFFSQIYEIAIVMGVKHKVRKIKYNSNFEFLGKDKINIRKPNREDIVTITKNQRTGHFSITRKDFIEINVNMNLNKKGNEQIKKDFLDHFNALQTLNKSQ